MFEWFQFSFMVQALVACVAMGLVLSYLGIHVVGRGIVFVDLALGQISSMGVAFAAYSGRDPVLWSMAFTVVGAVIFSGLRVTDSRLRLEALIGIFYAASSALTVLLIAKTPHGDADVQDVLFGSVLAISPADLRRMLVVFAVVAVLNIVLGKRFFALTYRSGSGSLSNRGAYLTNLVFYLLLAMAIVFAISAGGVIPVFAYLIIPPVAAAFLTRGTGMALVLTLVVSVLGSFLGLHLSYSADLPAGASIVAVLGALTLVAVGVAALKPAIARLRRGAGAALLLVALAVIPARAGAQQDVEHLTTELDQLKEIVSQATARIAALEAEVERLRAAQETPAPTALAAPVAVAPAASRGGLRLIDISLDGLFAGGASSAREPELRALEAGGHDPKNRGFTVQNVELALAGAVDPYLRGDAFLVFQIDDQGESAVELEEAYLTTLSLPAGLQVKAGTFFSSFGRLNSQHPHSWDFADQPIVSSRLMGPDGLRGPGAQLNWLLPTPFFAEASVAVQNSRGPIAQSFLSVPGEDFAGRELFERDVRSFDDLLSIGRFSSSFEPSDSFTIVTGASHVAGPNATGPDSRTKITGLDFYGKWRPLSNQRGWPFFAIQTEIMQRDFEAAEQQLGDGSRLAREHLTDWGAYAQATWGFRPRWVAGLRGDWVGGDGDASGDPVRDRRFRLSPNLTFYPSEFSKFRLQYNLDRPDHLDRTISSLFFQFEFLYGAHGGHKF